MKKLLALALALSLLVTVLAACGQTSSQELPPPKESTGVINMYGWEVPAETIEISIHYGQDTAGDFENYAPALCDYILQEFNVKLDWQVTDTDYGERQSLMLASGDYPDVIAKIWDPKQTQNWIAAGKALDLLPLIEEYAPGIKDNMGDYFNRYIDEEGHMYFMPEEWGWWPTTLSAGSVRYDWYQEIGSPDISTASAYYEALKQMVANHPTGTDGNKTYALGAYNAEFFSRCFLEMWNFRYWWDIDEENNYEFTYFTNSERGLDCVKWLNQIYRDGLYDPDSFTQTFDDVGAKFANERYAGHLGSWWMVGDWGENQWCENEGWTENQRMVQYNPRGDSAERTALTVIKTYGYTQCIVTDKARDLEGIMKWFEFETSEPGMRLIGWGVPNEEGSVWTMNEDGSWSLDEEDKQAYLSDPQGFDYEPANKLGQGLILATCMAQNSLDGSFTPWWDQNFRDEEKWTKLMNDNCAEGMWDGAYYLAIQIPAESNEATINQTITDLRNTGWAECITAPTEEECVARFELLRDEINASGLETLEKYYEEKYRGYVEAWG